MLKGFNLPFEFTVIGTKSINVFIPVWGKSLKDFGSYRISLFRQLIKDFGHLIHII